MHIQIEPALDEIGQNAVRETGPRALCGTVRETHRMHNRAGDAYRCAMEMRCRQCIAQAGNCREVGNPRPSAVEHRPPCPRRCAASGWGLLVRIQADSEFHPLCKFDRPPDFTAGILPGMDVQINIALEERKEERVGNGVPSFLQKYCR